MLAALLCQFQTISQIPKNVWDYADSTPCSLFWYSLCWNVCWTTILGKYCNSCLVYLAIQSSICDLTSVLVLMTTVSPEKMCGNICNGDTDRYNSPISVIPFLYSIKGKHFYFCFCWCWRVHLTSCLVNIVKRTVIEVQSL